MGSDHFKGKSAVEHVAEAQARGIIAAAEIHGTEIPGSIAAGTDGARETVIVLLLLNLLAMNMGWSYGVTLSIFAIFAFGWLIWKTGRSAWLGWSRLERLHRILEEERWEIEHNRGQEREELKALYAAKGFEGKLLEDVMDVLMADGDRLLKVMIEEELGLTLEVHEHPLQQALGAALGVFIAAILCITGYLAALNIGLFAAAFITILMSSFISAKAQRNELISAIVWNLAIAFISIGMAYFLLDFFHVLGWV